MPRHREPVLPGAFVAPAELRAAGQVTSGPHRSPGQSLVELRARFHGDLPADLLLQEMKVTTRIVFPSPTRSRLRCQLVSVMVKTAYVACGMKMGKCQVMVSRVVPQPLAGIASPMANRTLPCARITGRARLFSE